MQDTTSKADLKAAVAAAVRVELARRRWTQKKLRERTGWSVPFLSRRMAGIVEFSLADLFEIARVTGASPVEIVHGAAVEMLGDSSSAPALPRSDAA